MKDIDKDDRKMASDAYAGGIRSEHTANLITQDNWNDLAALNWEDHCTMAGGLDAVAGRDFGRWISAGKKVPITDKCRSTEERWLTISTLSRLV